MIRIYLNMAWKLLQKNLLSIVIFKTVYRLFSNQQVSRLANAAINFSLKQLGTSYLTSENFNKIMLHPLTLLLIFGILLVFFFCMLFEIYAVMAALEASWKRKRISVPVMMLAGGRGAAQFVRARPWTWFLSILFSISGCTTSAVFLPWRMGCLLCRRSACRVFSARRGLRLRRRRRGRWRFLRRSRRGFWWRG